MRFLEMPKCGPQVAAGRALDTLSPSETLRLPQLCFFNLRVFIEE